MDVLEKATGVWDKMALTYPRYDDVAMQNDVYHVLQWCEQQGVNFSEKTILDIGCGTGTVAIPLAKKGASITALDISDGMLGVLNEYMKVLGLEPSIRLCQGDWKVYTPRQTYDIVMASLSPAISSEAAIEKMLNVTHDTGIYVGWGAYKKNLFLDMLAHSHNIPDKTSTGCIKVKQFIEVLEQKNVPCQTHFFKTEWEDIFLPEEAKEFATMMLMRKEVEPDMSVIETVIKMFMQGNKVLVKTEAEKGVVLFSVRNDTYCLKGY